MGAAVQGCTRLYTAAPRGTKDWRGCVSGGAPALQGVPGLLLPEATRKACAAEHQERSVMMLADGTWADQTRDQTTVVALGCQQVSRRRCSRGGGLL